MSDQILNVLLFLGNKVRVCRVFGGPELYVVTNGPKVVEEFNNFEDAKNCAYEFVKAMSALRRER